MSVAGKIAPLSRRRVITVVGVAAGAALTGTGAFLLRDGRRLEPVEWSGIALGAPSRIILFHENSDQANELIAGLADDITRLEAQFSLFNDHSAISKINREGRIATPAADMVALLEESVRISKTTAVRSIRPYSRSGIFMSGALPQEDLPNKRKWRGPLVLWTGA